eukprot:5668060-Amphidinium_carterae.1
MQSAAGCGVSSGLKGAEASSMLCGGVNNRGLSRESGGSHCSDMEKPCQAYSNAYVNMYISLHAWAFDILLFDACLCAVFFCNMFDSFCASVTRSGGSSSGLMNGDATPFFGNGAQDTVCHDDAWKGDLKSILEKVVHAEHQLTRQSLSRMQSTLDAVLAASE